MKQYTDEQRLLIMQKHESIFASVDSFSFSQNCPIWKDENPHVIEEKPMHSQKGTVCCSFHGGGVTESNFFENTAGIAVTVNGERYRYFL